MEEAGAVRSYDPPYVRSCDTSYVRMAGRLVTSVLRGVMYVVVVLQCRPATTE